MQRETRQLHAKGKNATGQMGHDGGTVAGTDLNG